VTPEFELEDGMMAPSTSPGIGVMPDLPRILEMAIRRETFGAIE
jgi:hypothetical protein